MFRAVERATEKVEWTVKRLPKVRGVNIWPYIVIRGDDKEHGQ